LTKPLVVTTAHRGVFFGYGEPTDAPTIRLERARMCLFWPEAQHGLTGLAKDGPKDGARVSPAAPAVILRDVTAVFACSDVAAQRWEAEPWSD
jgi:hypothetical protein